MSELWRLSAGALASHFASGQASPLEALDSALERIAKLDGSVGAFSCVLTEESRASASQLTEELANGHCRGPLHGVPVAVKELFNVRGAPADYGSDALAGALAGTDAELVRRLRRAGAVIVGTTRSHEFGWGITTQHQSRPCTANPWDLRRVPGGSSGGSGAAVAAGMVPIAVGSDTGGSIRIPAAFCGVTGLKPAFGSVGRSGGVALAPSFDTPGALARTIEDAAALVAAMSGPDSGDPDTAASRRWRLSCRTLLRHSLDGVRVATAAALTDMRLDSGVSAAYRRVLAALERLGAELVEVDLPAASAILEAFIPIQMAEVHHVHSRTLKLFPGHAHKYGDDVRSRLEAAAAVSVGDYLSAQQRRRHFAAAFDRQLRHVDALISPISAVSPSLAASSDEARLNGQPRLLRDVVLPFTVPQNMTGLPAGIVRAGFDTDGLPVGVQLCASRYRINTVVALTATLQTALGPIEPAPEPDAEHDRAGEGNAPGPG